MIIHKIEIKYIEFKIKICCLIILSLLFYRKKHYNHYINKSKKDELYKNLIEINKWIYLCRNKILIRGILNSIEKPKITALITIFNSHKYIDTAIKSVQNQFFSDIEILIVDDGSTDNSSLIINKLQKNDKRIKIIQNKINRGALYSKSIGILKASGTFTMLLDSDDLFANENIFQICYLEAIKNNIDIVEFSGYNLNSQYFKLNSTPEVPYYLKFKTNNELIRQPNLSFFIYQKRGKNDYKLIDGFIWGKCVKSNIFKLTLKVVGNNVYTKKVNYCDDRIINFILFKVANSFKYIEKYGIIYNFNINSSTHSNKYVDYCHDELINIMSIYNYTKKSNEINIAAFEIINRWKRIIFPGINFSNYKYAIQLIDGLLQNKYISSSYRLKLVYLQNNLTESKRLKLFNFSK